MNKRFLSLVAVLLPAFFLAGCETDGGITARTQEKSEVYAKLKLSEKRFIAKGVIALGFTSDMVYMAMGHPTQVEYKDYPEGRRELWTYSHYYPNYDAAQGFRYVPYTAESHYAMIVAMTGPGEFADHHPDAPNRGPTVPNGMDRGNLGLPISGGSPPQGGSTEPADLQSFTVTVLFKEGKVARFGADPNVN